MRLSRTALGLLIALPAAAQGLERHWSADVHAFAPSLGGRLEGIADGNRFRVDLGRDLALSPDRSQAGLGLEYQGPRFGGAFTWDQQRYAGRNVLDRDVLINGRVFPGGSVITSVVRTTTATFDWTVRAMVREGFWLGLDLGLRYAGLKIDARGAVDLPGAGPGTSYRAAAPVPQAGPALGFAALGGRLAGRAQALFLAWRGAACNRFGFDLRFFPLPWLGVRAFTDSERVRMPEGAAVRGLDLLLDRAGTGLGVVLRF